MHRPAGRQATRSTSLRSSTASSDGVCSPGNTKRTGASSVHSYFTADPHAHGTERHAHPHKAEPVRLSHSLFSNHEYGLGLDAQRQTLSPGAGSVTNHLPCHDPACDDGVLCIAEVKRLHAGMQYMLSHLHFQVHIHIPVFCQRLESIVPLTTSKCSAYCGSYNVRIHLPLVNHVSNML